MTLPDIPVVSIDSGAVRGVWRAGSAAYLGIPFAQPPVGDLRFAAPVPVEPWQGVRDATEYGATALRTDPGNTIIPEPAIPGDSTLNVNVFAPFPQNADAALPVLVYIHGGGYTAGSPASPWYDGAAFTRDGVVTVTISYRLGFDGFGYIDGAPHNRGVRDWLAALEWVQRNIAAFGGDPARVTLAGQSAGGGAVLTLLSMPRAQHLFHAAWVMSAALGDVSEDAARERATRLAALAGVTADRTGFASVPEEKLQGLLNRAAHAETRDRLAPVRDMIDDGPSWAPMVDGDLIPLPPVEALREGVGAGKPLVIGATDDEFTMVLDPLRRILAVVPAGFALGRLGVPGPVRAEYLRANTDRRRAGTAAILGRFVTDRVFRSLVARVATARSRSHAPEAAPTWVYRFSWPSPTKRWACHCLDVPFFFDALGAEGTTALLGDAPPRALATAVHGAAVAFARTQDPGWRAWSAAPGSTRVFGGPASAPDVLPDGYASVAALY
ncbi:MAG: carboxylesterase family protein [Microbacterium sp.]|uniref:carboxylesterase/lipase family protein n=1 Tax=Microbacterium sp. TaxID=51671 RepID=UPI00262EA693|nr:carboxylesterase family protein [Microbacterium sp.]MCX6501998.1 carboxylesterase family protein [Microbacterium sp.]